MVDDDLFANPSEVLGGGSGDLIKLQEFGDRLIVLRAKSGDEKTMVKDGETLTYIEAELLDVKDGDAGWRELWIFPVVVLGQVKRAYPKPVVGVLGKGEPSKAGRSAPWILNDASAAQIKAARAAYVKAEAGF